MYEVQKGRRCRVCMGCGLCPGVTAERPVAAEGPGNSEALQVLTDSPFARETQGVSGGSVRLVTADVGTTTVAMLFYGADGSVEDRYVALNPQTAYGADVISRIRAAENSDKAGDMRSKILGVLEQGLERFKKRLAAGESLQLVLAANTTMTYLLMGWDTSELGRAPFRASHLNGAEVDIGGVPCFVFPGISAFVGGDVVAGMYACGMEKQDEITLLVDLGTNGEIVLGGRAKRIACATAAGPAFEGGVNRGVWGADMVSRLAALRRTGLLDETGLLAEECFESGVRVGNVHVTRNAVRAVQLAKGAIAAGIEVLLEKYGIKEEQVDRVVLAGGFGYYLNPEDAAEIGLLGQTLAGKAMAGGNTALSGALKAGRELCARQGNGAWAEEGKIGSRKASDDFKEELQKLICGTEVLNLAEEPGFEKRYIEAINLQSRIDNL
ncbi:MAG: ASKHA domain-containing protein [Acetatifactor sp.]|nr:ASKHA domain-containing protein [Acetatifactor sp.]